MAPAKKKKEELIEVLLNIKWHTTAVNWDMTEDEIDARIWFALQCAWQAEMLTKDFKISNVQLEEENKWFNEINNQLNFNIEIQTMMLNILKKEVWDDRYAEIRKQVTTCDEFKKLKSRAWL